MKRDDAITYRSFQNEPWLAQVLEVDADGKHADISIPAGFGPPLKLRRIKLCDGPEDCGCLVLQATGDTA